MVESEHPNPASPHTKGGQGFEQPLSTYSLWFRPVSDFRGVLRNVSIGVEKQLSTGEHWSSAQECTAPRLW